MVCPTDVMADSHVSVWGGNMASVGMSRYADPAMAPAPTASPLPFAADKGGCCCDTVELGSNEQTRPLPSSNSVLVGRLDGAARAVVQSLGQLPQKALQRQALESYFELLVHNLLGIRNIRLFAAGCFIR
eukprot:SAG31_NODE_932_length_10913_cov_3.933235_16_plen_130_part_00